MTRLVGAAHAVVGDLVAARVVDAEGADLVAEALPPARARR